MVEDIPKIFLSTFVTELEVLYESIVDFENLKQKGFDPYGDVAA